jgi:EAL domain-containing protein (putative c-di-GMP-specific phosphodiesterase class I)
MVTKWNETPGAADVKLLVLDDDPAIGETISMMAKRAGVECRFTCLAEDFFDALAHWHPTHIALDLAMPGHDGIEAIRRLAELGCEAMIILISGTDGRVLDAAYRAGRNHGLNVAGAIAKPFSFAALREFVVAKPVPIPSPSELELEPLALPRVDEGMLVRAMDAGHIGVAFQPKVVCRNGALAGFEGLARWSHPECGAIPPDSFIPIAEKNGLCARLTEIVFDTALAWFGGLRMSELTLSLNVSATSLDDIGLADRLAALCEQHDVRPDRMIVEVTESSAIYDQTVALDLLVRLRLKGFRLSIDDFGVGYSSLSQLARMPFSELKIDKSFVINTCQSQESRNIIKAIVGLSKSLGLSTVAEGVEDLSTLHMLREIGCDQAQGYFIGRPMNRRAMAAWLGGEEEVDDQDDLTAQAAAGGR